MMKLICEYLPVQRHACVMVLFNSFVRLCSLEIFSEVLLYYPPVRLSRPLHACLFRPFDQCQREYVTTSDGLRNQHLVHVVQL